jgi:hypothetical protein
VRRLSQLRVSGGVSVRRDSGNGKDRKH